MPPPRATRSESASPPGSSAYSGAPSGTKARSGATSRKPAAMIELVKKAISSGPATPAGQPFSFTINKYDVVNLETDAVPGPVRERVRPPSREVDLVTRGAIGEGVLADGLEDAERRR